MHRIGFDVNNIHRYLFTHNLEKLNEVLPFTSPLAFNQRYICWKPIEHAKLNLKHAIMFNQKAIDLCEKIYHLVRDYTLFHSINDRIYHNIKKIFRSYNQGIDLTKEIAFFGKKITLDELLQIEKKENGLEIRIFYNPKNKLHQSL